ncbi:MAG: hypothetical protein WCJ58_06670 [bacterium]
MATEEKKTIDFSKVESNLKSNQQKTKTKKGGCKKLIFISLTAFIAFVAVLILLAFIAPGVFVVLINIIWVIIFCIVVVFIGLGVLIMVGLKKEAERLINILLEGSLTILDLMNFLKETFILFKKYLEELVYIITPIFSYFLCAVIYIALMYLYKFVGKDNDLAIFTVILTAVLTFIVGIFNKPKKPDHRKKKWFQLVKIRFIKHFKDALEVLIFVFFITLDSTKIFFLPKELNVELHAHWADYNLMIRSFTLDSHLKVTITLVMFAIGVEIIRNVIRIIMMAIRNFRLAVEYLEKRNKVFSTAEVVKLVIREGVKQSMDELLKFITFTTVLVAVFLLFPRLKLLSMVVASITGLVLDLIIIERLRMENKGEDLISRLIVKVFRL